MSKQFKENELLLVVAESSRVKNKKDRTYDTDTLNIIPKVISEAVRLSEKDKLKQKSFVTILDKWISQGALDVSSIQSDGSFRNEYEILSEAFELVVNDLLDKKDITKDEINYITKLSELKETHVPIDKAAEMLETNVTDIRDLISNGDIDKGSVIKIGSYVIIELSAINSYRIALMNDAITIDQAIQMSNGDVDSVISRLSEGTLKYKYLSKSGKFIIRQSSLRDVSKSKDTVKKETKSKSKEPTKEDPKTESKDESKDPKK